MEHWEWTGAADVDGGAIFEKTHERSPARLPADLPREGSPTIRALGTVLLRRSLRTAGGGENEESTMPWQAAHDGAITSVMETGCKAARDSGRRRQASACCKNPLRLAQVPPPAGPRVGLTVASVAVGHLPTGRSPGSTARSRAALVDRTPEGSSALLGARGCGRTTGRTPLGVRGLEVTTESSSTAKVRGVRPRWGIRSSLADQLGP